MLMILQWLETYDLNGETVMVAPAAGFTLPGMGQRIGYVLKKKKEDLIRAVQIIKQRYQSITQGKVIAKG
jgi:aspartate aminotransferase